MIHFQFYIGTPSNNDIDCVFENLKTQSCLMHSNFQWGFEQAINLDFFENKYCKKLIRENNHPAHISDVYRIWYLSQHPDYIYLDCDCIDYGWTPPNDGRVYLPSVSHIIKEIADGHGVEVDNSLVKNTCGTWPDVFIIYANGNGDFFKRLLEIWAEKYCFMGGVAEALTYEPFDFGIIPEITYNHKSTRKTSWIKEIKNGSGN